MSHGMTTTLRVWCLTAMAFVIAAPAMAQWLNQPTPGIPRTADGKPNLTARAPRTPDRKPDLSGIWRRKADRYYNNVAADLKPGDVLPWAESLYQQRRVDFGKDSMEVRCLPFGPATSTTPYADAKILQTPTLIAAFRTIPIRAGWDTRSADGTGTRSWWRAPASPTARGSTTTAIPTQKR